MQYPRNKHLILHYLFIENATTHYLLFDSSNYITEYRMSLGPIIAFKKPIGKKEPLEQEDNHLFYSLIHVLMKRKHVVTGALIAITGTSLLLHSCRTIPKGVSAVDNFDKTKYLGKWFEIARFDYSFEKNLNNVTAEYSLKNNGNIKVINRGYNFKKNKEQKSVGKAKFVGAETVGELKVSFFGPFYAG
ncbi:MAG: lipocalin family protein, partial [Ginsengibacter sp.]